MTTQNCDTLIHPSFIIPVRPKGLLLKHHSLAILDGLILELLPTDEALIKYQAKDSFKLDNQVIMPGFINAHGHSAMSLFRGLANDLPLMEWLNDHIWPAEGAHVSREFVKDGTQLAIAEMIKSGTTCYSDMYFFADESAEVAKEAGMRAQFCCPILDFPTVCGTGADDYIDQALQLAEKYATEPLITIGLGPHAPYTVSDEPLQRIKSLASEHKLPIQIHLHETQNEVDEAITSTGKRPIKRLEELGLFSEDLQLQCVHMTALNDKDISILKNSNAHVIHCPESNMKLASGFCETAKLLKANINVAIGTDGAASNNDLDMIGETRSAALIAKPIAQDASAVDAATALEMATINGARALGIDKLTGSIEKGKAADLIAIDLDQLNSQPSFDPISDIVYSVAANQVSHNWVAGRLLLNEGKLLHFDEKELIKTAKDWAERISTNN